MADSLSSAGRALLVCCIYALFGCVAVVLMLAQLAVLVWLLLRWFVLTPFSALQAAGRWIGGGR